jgi:hypothetical protein
MLPWELTRLDDPSRLDRYLEDAEELIPIA